MVGRPKKVSDVADKELDKVEKHFDEFDSSVKKMTLDHTREAPKHDIEPQTKLSQRELEKTKDVYLKPHRTIFSKDKFNEKYREDYNFAKEYVHIIAENNEIKGETIDMWTKPFAGVPAEEWLVPTNKPVWVPRYVAERIKGCEYSKFSMDNKTTGADGNAQYYGTMSVETKVARLDARPVGARKSIFMGSI